MSCFSQDPNVDVAMKESHKQATKILKESNEEMNRTIKLLLLGAGESGKMFVQCYNH
jgi:N-acetylmuramic acid 6-phosphate (MurNAc-6-P) etherase